MRRRRANKSELNFDGLTDSVTNLVGSLILLVVLVIAVTRPKERGVTELPVPENTPGDSKAIDPLLEELRVLREQIQELDGEIQQMENRIPEIDAEVQSLRQQSRANSS